MGRIRLAKDNEVKEILQLEKLWKKESITPNAILSSKKDIEKAIKEKRVLVALKRMKLLDFYFISFGVKTLVN